MYSKLSMLSMLVLCGTTPAFSEGRFSSRDCPYSCQSQGIPKEQCRDWREGSKCFIEDKRVQAAPAQPMANTVCQSGQSYTAPRIDVSDEMPLNRSGRSDELRVSGIVEGQCIKEAGYYEGGNLIQRIPIDSTNEFRRFNFEINGQADPRRNGEIRAYNINGERASYRVGTQTYRAMPREDTFRGEERHDRDIGHDYDYNYDQRGSERDEEPASSIGREIDDFMNR